jgi:hypothetical protein
MGIRTLKADIDKKDVILIDWIVHSDNFLSGAINLSISHTALLPCA